MKLVLIPLTLLRYLDYTFRSTPISTFFCPVYVHAVYMVGLLVLTHVLERMSRHFRF